MKPAMRWMLAALLGMPLAGCVYYPDYGYVRGYGYGATGSVYYESSVYDDGYYGGYQGSYYGGYYRPYGYSPYYWPGYYSIGIDVHDGHHGHGGHYGHGWQGHDGGRHDARPSHRSGPEVSSRRRR